MSLKDITNVRYCYFYQVSSAFPFKPKHCIVPIDCVRVVDEQLSNRHQLTSGMLKTTSGVR